MLSSPLSYRPTPQFPRKTLIFKFTPKSPSFLHHTYIKTTSTKSYSNICVPCPCSNSESVHYIDENFDVELGRLVSLLPEEMRRRVNEHPELRHLVEVVMDLGRKPLARYPSGDFVLSDHPITMDDIKHATSLVGDFAIDNRAGISRTLHRISAIRNRKGQIIGLTCRVGRAVSGSASLLRDLVKDGASLLLIGPPGVGKTTIIRDIARMLANDYNKRVMIVDTSNEIGGDGDIPHAGIGYARRMQVPNSDMQHKVLIEAVENHMPQVIVIDEIGTKLEAAAASTIAQRGIQLVATAHGITIENLVMNPSLEMLVGGIQSVTLGDEEASRRGVQKSVLERKGPSTFSCGVEIISKFELRIHRSLEATVDSILAGHSPKFEVRKLHHTAKDGSVELNQFVRDPFDKNLGIASDNNLQNSDERPTTFEFSTKESQSVETNYFEDMPPLRLFLYGISEATALQGFKHLKMDNAVEFTENISEADALLVLLSKIKKNAKIQAAAKSHGIPIYVTKTSSLTQLTNAIEALMTDYDDGFEDFKAEAKINDSEKVDALEEARIAIEQVVIPKGESVELLPRASNIILLQKDLIRKYKLQSERVGMDSDERLRIHPFESRPSEDEKDSSERVDADTKSAELFNPNDSTNGSAYTVDKLPLLPDWE